MAPDLKYAKGFLPTSNRILGPSEDLGAQESIML